MEKVKGFLFSLILAFGIVASRSIPSSASAYVIDPSTIGSIGDLGLGLLGGAEFDFTGSKYQIENYDSLSQADQVDAAIGATNQFIDDYWSARKEYIKANNGFLQETYKVYDNYALKNAGLLNTDTNFHISGQLATDWMQYSKYWYQDYANSFVSESSAPIPEPDDNYITYLNRINSVQSNGFFFKNFSSYCNTIPGYNPGTYAMNFKVGGFSDYTWFYKSSTDQWNNNAVQVRGCDVSTIYITSNNNVYSYSITLTPQKLWNRLYNGNINTSDFTSIYIYKDGNYTWYSTGDPSVTFSKSGTLTQVLDDIARQIRNVNIYVDGQLWAVAGNVVLPDDLIPDFPDVIGTDNDPIYTLDLPDTSNYEGAFDITSLFDAIKEAIIGASDSDNTTSGVISGEAVSDLVVDDTGTLVGTKAVPISTVLDDSIEGEATKRLPNIELYPDKIHDAFSGTTLLADVILATQESLPSAIIVVFWGIVICLIVIALIKSLHR